ncbi:MAG: amidase domain-containing protein [Byssovorax sp.]
MSLDAVREAVRTRWSTIREGELITEADAKVLQLRQNVIRDVQLQANELRIISVQPHVARTRLLGGGFFDVSKSFLLPNGLDGIRAIVASYNQEPNARLLIVGHTDTAGRPDDNDLLSLERACALKDYLTDNAEGWLTWYGQVPSEKRWGAKEDLLMLDSLPDASTRSLNEPTVRWFQRTRGLTVDGVAGPETRGQLITEYMALDGTSLPAGIEPIVHGCGERFPQDPTPDGVADPDNRRVEVFFFDGALGVQPPSPGRNSAPGAPEYPEWAKRSKRTDDHVAAVELSICRDQSCVFYEGKGHAWAERVGPRVTSSSACATPDAPGAAGWPSFPSMGTSTLQLQSIPGVSVAAPLVSAHSPSAYSPSAAVAYARKWALGANPDYERFGQDCTNFISQALFVGGWNMVQSTDVCDDVTDDNVWWFRREACWHLLSRNVHCSNTWAVASHLYRFLKNSGRATAVNNLWDLEPGDVLQKDYGDDYIKHSLILSEKNEDNLYFCSHSLDYADEPFFGRGGILNRNPGVKWYGFHII